MKLFKKNKIEESRTLEEDLGIWNAFLLAAGLTVDDIDREKALNIPTLQACVELIANTIAMIPIKLYKIEDDAVKEIKDDYRLRLLNDETGDTLNAFELWKAMVYDYLLEGNAYAYINKERNKIKSIHYVEHNKVSINKNNDPIFKSYDIWVNGERYKSYDFLKILRNTSDGAEGIGIIKSSNMLLAVIHNSLKYENVLAKTGGNKKGFLESEGKLESNMIDKLKEQWRKMYSQNSENCVVLNKGLKFKESSATSTEMQMNENKKVNSEEICKICSVPPSLIGEGKAAVGTDEHQKLMKIAILPLLQVIATAINRDCLLEKEKESFYFAHDTKEIMKGDIEKRFKAYEIGIKNKILTINEARYEEDKEPIEAFNDTVVLGLNDVLYNTKTGSIYTPNTDKTTSLNLPKGGE